MSDTSGERQAEAIGELFTTQEVADGFGLNMAELERLIHSGELRKVKSSVAGEPCIPAFEAVRFVRQQGNPLPSFLQQYSRHVLVTEDEPLMAKAIVRVLHSAGYTTMIAPDGFQAGSVLESFCPAVLILDLSMPFVNGLEILKYIRECERHAHIKVVVVSAAPRKQLEAARAAGADCVLEKPFDNDVLLSVIADLADKASPPSSRNPEVDRYLS